MWPSDLHFIKFSDYGLDPTQHALYWVVAIASFLAGTLHRTLALWISRIPSRVWIITFAIGLTAMFLLAGCVHVTITVTPAAASECVEPTPR